MVRCAPSKKSAAWSLVTSDPPDRGIRKNVKRKPSAPSQTCQRQEDKRKEQRKGRRKRRYAHLERDLGLDALKKVRDVDFGRRVLVRRLVEEVLDDFLDDDAAAGVDGGGGAVSFISWDIGKWRCVGDVSAKMGRRARERTVLGGDMSGARPRRN